MKSKRGGMSAKEAEKVVAVLSRITGGTFEVGAPSPDYPVEAKDVDWFASFREGTEAGETPYVNSVWMGKDGTLRLESPPLGDTVYWIGLAYGDEAAGRSMDLDYSNFDSKESKELFGKLFPRVLARIEAYDAIAAKLSEKGEPKLEVRRVGSKGVLVLALSARIPIKKMDARSIGRIEESVKALRDAYHEIFQMS